METNPDFDQWWLDDYTFMQLIELGEFENAAAYMFACGQIAQLQQEKVRMAEISTHIEESFDKFFDKYK